MDAERSETFEDPSIINPEQRERLFGDVSHARAYWRDFKERLEHVGFLVRQEFYAQELGPSLAQRYGLLVELEMFYCWKPRRKV